MIKKQKLNQARENELNQLIEGSNLTHEDILRRAKPHQIEYYLKVREDIESKYRLKGEIVQDEPELSEIAESNHQENYFEDGEASDQELEDEFTQADNVTIQEVSRELLNKQNGQTHYKVCYNNGDVYEGELEDDCKDGSGIYNYQNGEKYEGLFQDDLIHGYGCYYFLGGHKYEGDWLYGEKSGFGILEFADGNKYQGEFYKDNFEGKGTYFYKNGDRFEGDWKNGKKNGCGRFYGKDGRRIIGEWIDDELQHF